MSKLSELLKTLPEADAIALRVGIGNKIAEEMKLKTDKLGFASLGSGKKSRQGIGSVVIGIVEQELNRFLDN